VSDTSPSTRNRTRLQQLLVALVFGWLGWRTFRLVEVGWPYNQDDAYITLRYARHLVEGHGIVWNVGERVPVEGYSNFLSMLLAAGALEVGLDPMLFLKVLGCAAIVPIWVLLYVLARRWLRPIAATLPAVLLASHPGFVFWAVSGLETTVYQLFVIAAVTAFILGLEAPVDGEPAGPHPRWSRFHMHLLAAALCLLASLTRPEGPLLAIVLGMTAALDGAVRFFRARRRGDLAAQAGVRRDLLVTVRAFTLVFAIPYAVYFLWRLIHFGRWAPNTVYCKATYNDKGDDPWYLIRDFWKEGKVFILLALVQDPRKLGARALPLFLLPVVYAAILFRADPIVGQHSRHFLAALGVLVVASAIGLVNLVSLPAPAVRAGRWLLLRRKRAESSEAQAAGGSPWLALVDVAVVVMCLGLHARGQAWTRLQVPGSRDLGAHDLADHDDPWTLSPTLDLAWHAACYASRMRGRADLGRYLDRALSPEQSYVLGDVGIAPYLSHASVIDAFCLNSAEMTRPPISFDVRRFIDSIFARAPDAIVVHSWAPAPRISPLDDELGFYPALVADKRFRNRYQPSKSAPAFHGPRGGEGYFYVVYDRRACSLSQPTGNDACDECLTSSCCSQANTCASDAACSACLSSDSASEGCGANAGFGALESCVAHDCKAQCVGD